MTVWSILVAAALVTPGASPWTTTHKPAKPAQDNTPQWEWLIARGTDVGLWGTGLNMFPDPRNPSEYNFRELVRSPTTQAFGRVVVRRRNIFGRPIDFNAQFNTYRLFAALNIRDIAVKGPYVTMFARGEALLGGMYVHYMQDGTNKRERGFWGTYVHAGSRLGVELTAGLRAEVEFGARAWMFNRGVRTEDRFVMPLSFWALEPRVRVEYRDVEATEANLLLPYGWSVMVEAGADFRNVTRPWGGLDAPGFGVEKRNTLPPNAVPRRVAGRALAGTPMGPLWFTANGEFGYGVQEDDITRGRIGGMSHYAINMPGAAFGEFYSERYLAVHGEMGFRANKYLYQGVSLHWATINDPYRVGELERYGQLRGVASETRVSMMRLGVVRVRLGGSPDVQRQKGLGSLGFYLWWEVGNWHEPEN